MIAVIFEAIPANGKWDDYLNLAARLKPELQNMEGFISVERFQSLTDPRKILSLSFWKDDKSIAQWRNLESHRMAQIAGRNTIFEDYRIRIANVSRDYGLENREQAPADSKLIHR